MRAMNQTSCLLCKENAIPTTCTFYNCVSAGKFSMWIISLCSDRMQNSALLIFDLIIPATVQLGKRLCM